MSTITATLSTFDSISSNDVQVSLPLRPLVKGSLHVATAKIFENLKPQDHKDSFTSLFSIAKSWDTPTTNAQYLIYSKVDSTPFKWEIVPYATANFFTRMIQQIKVLFRTIFGGITLSEKDQQMLSNTYQKQLNVHFPAESSVEKKGSDPFCQPERIEKQIVITGEKVNVLFNYAPIGLGGEKLHFLIVPKEHRQAFTNLAVDEYLESMELATHLVKHFKQNRQNVENIYLMSKTGKDAGQTVDHWHLHVIVSTSKTQDIWGKLTVFKNILFGGSSPMKADALKARVASLSQELNKSKTD